MRSFISLSIVLALAACKHHEAAPPAPAAKPQDLGAPTAVGVPGSQNLAGLSELGTRLSQESSHRPTVKVTPEHLFGALAERGITLAAQHQVLASTAGASYCTLAVTVDNIAIAVCEYPSQKDAIAGEHLMNTRYKQLVPDAVREINGNTLVTVANASSNRDVRDRVIETFKSL